MGCGMFLTRHAAVLPTAFEISTSYMPSHNVGVDPYTSSVQWSRRFLGLRLFMALAAAGWAGYGRHVERAIELVSRLGKELAGRGWTIANQSSMAVLCIEPPSGSADAKAIVDRVLASGRAWVSVADFEGRAVIRACVTHGETSLDDIMTLVAALESARGR